MSSIKIPDKHPIVFYGPKFEIVPGNTPVDVFIPGIKYLLRDEFTSPLPAGSVNGTNAEPGPGVRTVRDVESKIALSGGWAEFTPQATAVYAEQDLVFSTPVITRTAGVAVFNKFRCTTDGSFYPLALVTSATPTWNATHVEAGFHRAATALSLTATYNATAGPIVATFVADGTLYRLGLVADGAAGYKYYIKGGAFTYWTLLFRSAIGATASLYAAMAGYNAAFGADFARSPVALNVSNPLLSDTFSGTFGTPDVIGAVWTDAGTWATAAGVVACTPVAGTTNLVANPEFTTNTTDWASVAGATLTRRDYATAPDIDPTGGADNYGMEVANTGTANARGLNDGAFTLGNWYRAEANGYAPSANTTVNAHKMEFVNAAVDSLSKTGTTEDVWQTLTLTMRAKAILYQLLLYCTGSTAGDLTHWDKASVKLLPISTLITNQLLSTTDVLAEQVISAYTLGTQVGIVQADRSFAAKAAATAAAGQAVLSLKEVTGVGGVGLAVTDGITVNGTVYTIASVTGGSNVAYNDTTKTQTITLGANLGADVAADAKVGLDWASWNGSLHYFDGSGNIKVDEIKAGVYTNRGSTAKAFSADARLIVRKIGSEYRIFYAESLVGTAISTIAAEAMVGTYWGLFSTLPANTISSFCVYDTGAVTACYSNLDKFSQD